MMQIHHHILILGAGLDCMQLLLYESAERWIDGCSSAERGISF